MGKIFKIRNFDDQILRKCGYKRNQNGYSKQLKNRKFLFLDIQYIDGIVMKTKLENNQFIFIAANERDVKDLIKYKLVREIKK